MVLAHNVATARKKKGLTQEELASLTNVTVRTIQRIESGETTPRPYTLKAIAAALDTSFEALQSNIGTDPLQPGKAAAATAQHIRAETVNFLQLLCLSSFTYMILPFVHFLVPMQLLKRRNEQNPVILAYARAVIRRQIYWAIALPLVLLLTFAYNMFAAVYTGPSYYVHYLIPMFAMYLLNAVIISADTIRSRRLQLIHPTEQGS